MNNLSKNGCQIINGELIIKSGMRAEIPINKILWIEPDPDPYNPQVTIKTVAGITVKFCVNPKDKLRLKDIINQERGKSFAKGE